MAYMDPFRLVCYLAGLLGGVGVAAVFFRLRPVLARLLGFTMLAWAFNCFAFGVMLAIKMFAGPTPDWAKQLWTVNALLLAVVPFLLYSQLQDGVRNGDG